MQEDRFPTDRVCGQLYFSRDAPLNAHYSLTGTVENGTAAITPDLTSYPAGTRMTIEITPDDGDVFSPFPVTLAALKTLWWSPWTGT